MQTQQPPQPASTKTQARQNRKPNSKYHNDTFILFNSITESFPEPQTITQALKQFAWRKAMQAKHDALIRNQTSTLGPHDSAPNIVDCKWVFSN